jgi:diguanylate cyclase (GGDEF)-like protein
MMDQLDKTLAEQLHINEREVAHRKALLDLSNDEVKLLARHRPFIAENVDNIVSRFYERQVAEPEIALLIGDAETLSRLKAAMRSYILELFSGHYDTDYVNRRLRIGKVHKRIGVSPKLYISAIWLLEKILCESIEQHSANSNDEKCAPKVTGAINKLLKLDTQFVFDTYISSLLSEVELAKSQLEDHVTSLEDKVKERTRELEKISQMDELTGLFNQRAFVTHLGRELSQAERHRDSISLAFMDLNDFKQLNDQKGHLTGDVALAATGKALQQVIREGDFACRYGGDEFALILPRTDNAAASLVCERLESMFKQVVQEDSISFSIGVATTGPDEFVDMESLIRNADALMYIAKTESHKNPGFHLANESNPGDDNDTVSPQPEN